MNNLNFLKPVSIKNKMRVGPEYDGGYVVYKPSLYNVDVLMTYGVGWDINFEVDFYNLTNKTIHMFDPTMFGNQYINKRHCKRLLQRLQFKKLHKYLKYNNGWKKRIEYLQENDVWFHNEGIAVEKKGKYDTFENHLAEYGIVEKRVLLKIDIEENEYPILNDSMFYKNLSNIDQIIIEIHNIKNRLRELKTIIQKLKVEYEIVHIHGNNNSELFTLYNESCDIKFPDVIELTFVKQKSILPEDLLNEQINYPEKGLDYPNTPYKLDFRQLSFGE